MHTQEMSAAFQVPATEKQIGYLIRLLSERIEDPAVALEHIKWVNEHRLSKGLASAKISEYEKKPSFRRAFQISDNTEAQEDVEVGLYLVDGVAYKVKRAVYGSGFLYACRWDEDSTSFVKETGAVRKIRASHRMTLEQASPYGLAMSACAHCGRPLTDENSIALGLGPICAAKY